MMTFPSKPEVTSNLVLVSYSMFLTQLVWPCRVHTLVLSFLRSQSAMVVSSEHVANSRLSRNLGQEGGTGGSGTALARVLEQECELTQR